MVSLHGEDPKVERPAARGLGASPRALFSSLSRAERGRRPTTRSGGAYGARLTQVMLRSHSSAASSGVATTLGSLRRQSS